jgi:hypothetical protein
MHAPVNAGIENIEEDPLWCQAGERAKRAPKDAGLKFVITVYNMLIKLIL